jgi:hypothetical protein
VYSYTVVVKRDNQYAGFEVFITVTMNNVIFWNVKTNSIAPSVKLQYMTLTNPSAA